MLSLIHIYRLFSASHRKTAESRRNGGQNHEDDRKDNHSIHKVCHGLYNADRESQIHTEAVKQLHQHSGDVYKRQVKSFPMEDETS